MDRDNGMSMKPLSWGSVPIEFFVILCYFQLGHMQI